jgi:cyanophycin synthetase
VAGRFDHYICRRDDGLRGRDGDEVPRILAKALLAKGVPEAAISIIPDEQAAIDASLRMGQTGDLVLIFADALTRSWKQVIKFRPEGAPPAKTRVPEAQVQVPTPVAAAELHHDMEGLIRDERGVRFARESDD